RDRLIGEDTDPDPAATLDVTVDCTTCRFNLASGQAATAGGLETELAKRNLRTASRQASVAAFMLFAIFSAVRLQHSYSPSGAGAAAASGLRGPRPRPPAGRRPSGRSPRGARRGRRSSSRGAAVSGGISPLGSMSPL